MLRRVLSGYGECGVKWMLNLLAHFLGSVVGVPLNVMAMLPCFGCDFDRFLIFRYRFSGHRFAFIQKCGPFIPNVCVNHMMNAI